MISHSPKAINLQLFNELKRGMQELPCFPPKLMHWVCDVQTERPRIELVQGSGLSRSMVYSVTSSWGRFAVKAWPAGDTSLERLSQIHRFQDCLHDQHSPRNIVPKVIRNSLHESVVVDRDYLWEVTQWMTGAPIVQLGSISETQLDSAMASLAYLHARTAALGVTSRTAPGMVDRLRHLHSAKEFLTSCTWLGSRNTAERSELDQAARFVVELFHRDHDRISRRLHHYQTVALDCRWIVRDVWREHLFFEDERVVGVIDFGAARCDWVGFDLVRLLGSLLIPADPRWKSAREAYQKHGGVRSIDWEMLQELDRISTLFSAIQWLRWNAQGLVNWEDRGGRPKKRFLEIVERLSTAH